MESFLLKLLTPENLNSAVVMMLVLFTKDFVVGALRRLEKKLLTDKDKGNDALGQLAGAAADAIDNVKQLPKKK